MSCKDLKKFLDISRKYFEKVAKSSLQDLKLWYNS